VITRLSATFSAISLLFTTLVTAQTIYKCPGEGAEGSTSYSSDPCMNPAGEIINLEETNLTITRGLSDSELRLLKEIEDRDRNEKLNRSRNISAKNPASNASNSTQLQNNINCEHAHASVRAWQQRMTLPHSARESRYLHEELHKRMKQRDVACK